MRQIITEKKTIDIRPLTRAEIRGGREFGLGYTGPALTIDNFDVALDYCLGLQMDVDDMDMLTVPELQACFRALIAETWGVPVEEKNSLRSGNDSQTAIDETPATPA